MRAIVAAPTLSGSSSRFPAAAAASRSSRNCGLPPERSTASSTTCGGSCAASEWRAPARRVSSRESGPSSIRSCGRSARTRPPGSSRRVDQHDPGRSIRARARAPRTAPPTRRPSSGPARPRRSSERPARGRGSRSTTSWSLSHATPRPAARPRSTAPPRRRARSRSAASTGPAPGRWLRSPRAAGRAPRPRARPVHAEHLAQQFPPGRVGRVAHVHLAASAKQPSSLRRSWPPPPAAATCRCRSRPRARSATPSRAARAIADRSSVELARAAHQRQLESDRSLRGAARTGGPTSHACTGRDLPLTANGSSAVCSKLVFAPRSTSRVAYMRPAGALATSRAARFTVSPITAYQRRYAGPTAR